MLVLAGTGWFFLPTFAATPLGPPTWGNPDQAWSKRRPVTEADRALIASYRSGQKRSSFTTNFADDAAFQGQWEAKADDRSDLASCREPSNVVEGGQLTLKTLVATKCHSKFSTGSMWSKFRQKYGFFEASMKIANAGDQ
jgi:hypothetical protein